jgi:probable HAF family extracellular repeat protein
MQACLPSRGVREIATASVRLLVCLTAGFATLASGGPITFSTLDYPGALATWARGINNLGQIVGSYRDGTGDHGFVYTGGLFKTLDFPGADYPGGAATAARDINDSGMIVGTYGSATGNHGFSFDGTAYLSMDAPGADYTDTLGINNHGEIVGQYAGAGPPYPYFWFLYTGGAYVAFQKPATARSIALDIDDLGRVVGYEFDSPMGAITGFVYAGGSYTSVQFPGAVITAPNGISPSGNIIVGTFFDTLSGGDGNAHGFIYADGAFQMVDYPGALQTFIYGVNDQGQVVGQYHDGFTSHGFVGTPAAAIPEPPTASLVTVVMFGALVCARRQGVSVRSTVHRLSRRVRRRAAYQVLAKRA